MTHNEPKSLKSVWKYAFPHTIPVLTGFMFLGITYGILMQTKGYGVFYSFLMSAIAFCGSMQFVAITLLTTAFNPLQAFLLSIMVNARHLFYGISMLSKYKGLGKARFFLIYTLCDETFSIVSSVEPPKEVNPTHFYCLISFLDDIYWILGTLIGAIAFGTMITRFLPFLLFPENRKHPPIIDDLGKLLPPAMMGLLVVYCLKGVNILHQPYGIPELFSIILIVFLHLWKRNVLLSIGSGTICYMILVQIVF